MVRLRVLSGREVCRILEQHGFTEVRRRGSHVVTQRRTSEGTITVPIPDHAELAIGTLLSIIRQSRVARRHSNHRSDPCAGQDRRSSSSRGAATGEALTATLILPLASE
ncbi:MAG TPA: type II toxin-antitoxin system HicA family toxin [Methylomirabilota bacterium]|jgi:predicted RNA binding protein YcfA (HicA-like mRNA interferase family)|nr:type II toxin-antitoxin system HicA family toxin [Methylomirabilota bacterium]